MKHPDPVFRRRDLILGATIVALSLRVRTSSAADMTNIATLDSPAIDARQPSRTILIAVTRAGDRLVAVGEHGVIIYSDDNAASWTQAAVPVDVSLTCVAFASQLVGWAAGHFGVILNTTDGGKTWVTQLNGLQVNQLTLAAAQAAPTQDPNSPGAPLAMKRANLFDESGPSKPFLSILVVNPQKIYVFGAYRMTMLTEDGGKSWRDWSLHIDDKFSHNLYDSAIIGTDIYVAAETGLVFCSVDGGNNFLSVAPALGVTLFGIVGANDGSLLVFGVAGNCFRSTDQGKSWTAISLNTQDNITAGRLLAGGAILLCGLSGTLFLSQDNGATFTVLTNVPPMSISDVTVAANKKLIFVGYSGVTTVPPALLNI